MILAKLAQVRAAVVFREKAPELGLVGNVRALTIRDLVASKPLKWYELPRAVIEQHYLTHSLRPGEVVIPARGDRYRAWLFGGSDEPVFPVGQLHVITPSPQLNARYLAWYLNESSTQARIASVLTGTSIKALTKTSLLQLEVEVPPMAVQHQIAELDLTTERVLAIRHRLNELDTQETAYLTKKLLDSGSRRA